MDIREYIVDVILAVLLVISTLVLVMRLWQDLIIAVATVLMMSAFGGLFLSLAMKIRQLDESVMSRERTMRVNLEDLSNRMGQKYDNTIAHMEGIVNDLSRRMYR
jgi:hypothetical protein